MNQLVVVLLLLFVLASIGSFIYRKFILGDQKKRSRRVKITVGFSAMRGRRETMEDEHVVLTDLRSESQAFSPKDEESGPLAFFGVYDGHRGTRCAKYVAKHLHKNILDNENFIKGVQTKEVEQIEEGIKQGYSKTDSEFITEAIKKTNKFMDGSTSVTAILLGNSLHISNLGDSEALLVSNPATSQPDSNPFEVLTFKHKPNEESEKKRILAAGGMIFGNRVGGLSVSRSFGDADVKLPVEEDGYKVGILMSAEPYVRKPVVVGREKGHRYLLLGCDGVWEALSYQATVDFINEKLKAKEAEGEVTKEVLSEILGELGKEAMRKGCSDNISSVLVYFS